MLLKKFWSEDGMYCYEVTPAKRIVFVVNHDNSIKTIHLIDWRKEFTDMSIDYDIKGIYYMENLTPEDEGDIDVIDTDKLIRMVKFDEMEAVC